MDFSGKYQSPRSSLSYRRAESPQPTVSLLPRLPWIDSGARASVTCRSQEHMELVAEQLRDARITILASDKETRMIEVGKSEIESHCPGIFNKRTL